MPASAQYVLERKLHQVFAIASRHSTNIVYGGGVALNCVANAKLQKLYPDMWIMPNPADAGGSLGLLHLHTVRRFTGNTLTWDGVLHRPHTQHSLLMK